MTSSNTAISKDEWDIIIRPQRNWWDLHLADLWRYRDLIQLLVWRDFVAYYKQTILGPLWYVIQPILTTVVFTVVFGNIAQLSTDGLPPFLFYMAGTTVWSYFSACLVSTSNTFTVNSGDLWQSLLSAFEYADFGGHLQFDLLCHSACDVFGLCCLLYAERRRCTPHLVGLKPAAFGSYHGADGTGLRHYHFIPDHKIP